MRYVSFTIENYRAIKKKLVINLEKRLIPLVGINECGKTTILQAIFCFDNSNDNEYSGKHLSNLYNLYETDRSYIPTVSAKIETTPSELESIVKSYIDAYKASRGVVESDELKEYETSLEDKRRNKNIIVEISRDLENKKYTFNDLFNELPQDQQDKIAKEVISCLPYILYNDDFNDRPEDKIKITSNASGNKTGWEAIFDRVFRSTSPNYSLNKCLQENDPKLRKSILSDVESFLNDALTNEWRKFSPKREKIKLQLDINVSSSTLEVLIEDELNGKSRFFSISNRSKGFIWYYNFIMKIRFNPKHTDNIKDTIFLLDEPGSYLHENAQESLCKKLKEISLAEGIVVYCTHSPMLLIPQVISLNNIMIIEKSSKGYISAKNINTYKTNGKRNSAMQPVFESLMIPEYEMIHKDEKILCVEGIYDKYAVELFSGITKNVRVFASVNAESIINNIQYFIAYDKEYVALWDNDEEGKKCYGKAKKVFGVDQEEHFLLLPSKEHGKRRMEEMFENNDLAIIGDKLGITRPATYETIIATLFYSAKELQDEIIENISEETKRNFTILNGMVTKVLSA